MSNTAVPILPSQFLQEQLSVKQASKQLNLLKTKLDQALEIQKGDLNEQDQNYEVLLKKIKLPNHSQTTKIASQSRPYPQVKTKSNFIFSKDGMPVTNQAEDSEEAEKEKGGSRVLGVVDGEEIQIGKEPREFALYEDITYQSDNLLDLSLATKTSFGKKQKLSSSDKKIVRQVKKKLQVSSHHLDQLHFYAEYRSNIYLFLGETFPNQQTSKNQQNNFSNLKKSTKDFQQNELLQKEFQDDEQNQVCQKSLNQEIQGEDCDNVQNLQNVDDKLDNESVIIVVKVVPWKGYNKWNKSCYEITCSEHTKLTSFCNAVSNICEYSNIADRMKIKCVEGSYLFCGNTFYVDGNNPEVIAQIQDKIQLLTNHEISNYSIDQDHYGNTQETAQHFQHQNSMGNQQKNNYSIQQVQNQENINNNGQICNNNLGIQHKNSNFTSSKNTSNENCSSQQVINDFNEVNKNNVTNQCDNISNNTVFNIQNNAFEQLSNDDRNISQQYDNSFYNNNTVSYNNNKLVNMQNIEMRDLVVQIGSIASMVYCHKGVCEHSLEVVDVRLIDEQDDRRLSCYPIVSSEIVRTGKRCDVCQERNAEQVSYMDVDAPRAPCNWCARCFAMWHGCNVHESKAQVLPIVFP